jgi:hypothetical protein
MEDTKTRVKETQRNKEEVRRETKIWTKKKTNV